MNKKMTSAKIKERKAKMMRFNPEISKADASRGEKKAKELTTQILKGSGLDANDLIVLYSYVYKGGKAQDSFEVTITNKDKTKEINDYLRKEQRGFESKGYTLFAMPFYESNANKNGLASKMLEELNKCNEMYPGVGAPYTADEPRTEGIINVDTEMMVDSTKLKKEMLGSLELKNYLHALKAPASRSKADNVEDMLSELFAAYITEVDFDDNAQVEEAYIALDNKGDVFTGDRVTYMVSFSIKGDTDNGPYIDESDMEKKLRKVKAKIKVWDEDDVMKDGTF